MFELPRQLLWVCLQERITLCGVRCRTFAYGVMQVMLGVKSHMQVGSSLFGGDVADRVGLALWVRRGKNRGVEFWRGTVQSFHCGSGDVSAR